MREDIPQSCCQAPAEDQVKLQVKLHSPCKIFNGAGTISIFASKIIEQEYVLPYEDTFV